MHDTMNGYNDVIQCVCQSHGDLGLWLGIQQGPPVNISCFQLCKTHLDSHGMAMLFRVSQLAWHCTHITASRLLMKHGRVTFQRLPHQKSQEAELQLTQELVTTAAIVLLQNLEQHACLVQVERCELLWRHPCHLHGQAVLWKDTLRQLQMCPISFRLQTYRLKPTWLDGQNNHTLGKIKFELQAPQHIE